MVHIRTSIENTFFFKENIGGLKCAFEIQINIEVICKQLHTILKFQQFLK